jgi:hypothetical protein
VTLGAITGQSSLEIMKPTLTLNTRGFEFSLQELGEIIQWTELRDKGLNRVGLEVFPKINKDNPGKEVGIDAKYARGLEVIYGMHNYHINCTIKSFT